jgi:WD40 repeat protein
MSAVAPSTDPEPRAPLTSPFKGLAAFDDSELDGLLFFGREHERDVIVANLIGARLTVLYGPSGVGKSSILRAGVARDLRIAAEPPLVVVSDSWNEPPDEALAAAIAAAAGIEPAPLSETIDVAAALHREIYVLLDQVEEYFVYHGTDPALGVVLAELVGRPELRVHVLIGIREDALARLDAFKAHVPGLLTNRLRLGHLSVEAARQAIVGPVERFAEIVPTAGDVAVEPALVAAVLAGVQTHVLLRPQRGQGAVKDAEVEARVEAPYLQLVMERIWDVEQAQGSPVLRASTLDDLGGPARIVEEHLERALGALTPEQKQLTARMFNHLVTPSGMKIAHGTSDLAGYVAVREEQLVPILATLGAERILRPIGGDGPDVAHEIFHDVLADAVIAWRTAYDAEQALLREREEARRRHRRLLAIIIAALVALVAMAGVTLYALAQRRDAQRSADAARISARDAQQQTQLALEKTAEAEREKTREHALAVRATNSDMRAQQQTKKAQAEATQADASAAKARQETITADTAQSVAEGERKTAQTLAANEALLKRQADKSAADALRQKRSAVLNEKRANQLKRAADIAKLAAQKNARRAQAASDVLSASTDLTTNPAKSLQLAVQAASELPLLPQASQTLRQALLADRTLNVLDGGGGIVHDAQYSPDGQRIITADDARVYDAKTGKELDELKVGSEVTAASFSPDGSLLLTASKDRLARTWDASSYQLLHTFDQRGPITSASFSPDGKLVLTSGSNQTVKLWDASSGKLLRRIPLKHAVRQASFSPDSSHVLTMTNPDGLVRVFDITVSLKVQPVLLFTLATDHVNDARFSPDGNVISTVGADGNVRLWSALDGSPLFTMQAGGDLVSAAFSKDGTRLVTVGTQGIGRVWDVASGAPIAALTGHLSKINAAAFSPDGQWVVTAGSDGTARIWSLPDGTERATLLGSDNQPLQSVAFSGDGTRIITASADGQARIWNAEVDPVLRVLAATGSQIDTLAFSPDGKTIASGGADGNVRLWDVATRAAGAVLPVGAEVTSLAYGPGGGLLAAAAADGGTRVWHLPGGQGVVLQQDGPVKAVAISRDGSLVATAGSDDLVRLWNPAGGDPLSTIPMPSAVLGLAFDPTSNLLATAGADGVARTWDVNTGKPVRTFAGHTDAVNSVAFSADGKRLVTASRDHDVRVWKVATGEQIALFHGHSGSVAAAGFSADAHWVVSAGPAKAGVWSVPGDGLPESRLAFLAGHVGNLTAAAFAPKGTLIATAGEDGSIRTYSCTLCGTTPQLLRIAKARLAATQPPAG